jgi:hypothetical protein
MVQSSERARRLAIAAVVMTTVVGCVQPTGAGFRPLPVEDIPEGEAVVYLYRAHSVLGTVDRSNMLIGEEHVGALEVGQYTRVLVPAGRIRFATEGRYLAFVTANVEAGTEVFIRQRWVFRLGGFRPRVDRMTRIKAVNELGRCTYVEDPKLYVEEEEDPGEADPTHPSLPAPM